MMYVLLIMIYQKEYPTLNGLVFVNLGLLSGLSGEAMLLLVALKSNNIFWLDLLS